jgi:hypothetical protein
MGVVPPGQCFAIFDTSHDNGDHADDADRNHNGRNVGKEQKEDEEETTGSHNDEDKESSTTTRKTGRYIGFRNAGKYDRQAPQPLTIRNVVLSILPESIDSVLRTMDDTSSLPMMILGEKDDMTVLPPADRESIRSLQQYRDECQKIRARAHKFGVPYQPPALDTILPWSQARRLMANPSSHAVITGINITSDTERHKQEQRKARFGNLEKSAGETTKEEEKPKPDESFNLTKASSSGVSLSSVEQAWDKIDMVGAIHRVDPPSHLWKDPTHSTTDSSPNQLKDSFITNSPPQSAVLVPEKIHICSIDWAAFKQIRSQDIMKYFADYGPSYVEWLGDLSCNVQFEDPFSATRAMEYLSIELPSPPPPLTPQPASDNDGDDSNTGSREEMDEMEDPNAQSPQESIRPDLGRMGWRLGKQMLRKISNDKYGRKGTCARILMRVATSMDILVERPNQWPKPPPGFSTKRVLGPQADLPKRKEKNRQREKRKRSKHNGSEHAAPPPPPPMTAEDRINAGLRSSRDGFTLEQIEAERASKKRRTSEQQQ